MPALVRYPLPQPRLLYPAARSRVIRPPTPLEAPQTVAGLRLWLAARKETGLTNGAGVATPTNWAGLGNTLTQATGTKQPTYQTAVIDGQPVFRFAAATSREWNATSGDILNILNGVGGATIFVVVQRTATQTTTTEQFLDFRTGTTGTRFKYGYRALQGAPERWFASSIRTDGGAQVNVTGGVTVDTSWHLHTVVPNWSAGTIDFYREQTLDAGGVAFTTAGTTSATSSASASIGSQNTSEFLTGDIAEILVYDQILNSTDRQTVWDYLLGTYTSLAGAAKSGAAAATARTVTQATSRKNAVGAAAATGRIQTAGTAAKAAAGAATTATRTAATTSGVKASPAVLQGRTQATTSAAKAGQGTAVGSQRSVGLVSSGHSGVAVGQQRATPYAAAYYLDEYHDVYDWQPGRKGGLGVAAGAARSQGTATGTAATGHASTVTSQTRSQATSTGTAARRGTAAAQTRVVDAAAAVKAATGVAATQTRVVATAAGFHSSAATAQQRSTATTTARKATSGGGADAQRTQATTSAAKAGRGAGTTAQRTQAQVFSGRASAVTGQGRTASISSGRKDAATQATSNGRSVAVVSARKAALAGLAAEGRCQAVVSSRAAKTSSLTGQLRSHATSTAKTTRAAGATSQAHSAALASGLHAARGAATTAQRHQGTEVTIHVPPPRWVEHGATATGLVEGAGVVSGVVEGVLVGVGMVEGSSSL